MFRQGEEASFEARLAQWQTGIFGLSWLDDLTAANKATDLGGNGYPNRYLITAGELLGAISFGVPANDSPQVIGDYYALPRGWGSGLRIKTDVLAACPKDALLIVEAWDQS